MGERDGPVRCMRQTHAERTATSWCGRRIEPFEWVFTSIDHAVYSVMAEDRLVPCPECVAAITGVLMDAA